MAEGPKLVGKGFFSEPRGEEQAKVGVEGESVVGQFDAVHATREDDIGEEKGDIGVLLEDVQGFFAASGFKDVVSEPLDGFGDDFADVLLIFDNKDALALSLIVYRCVVCGDGSVGVGAFGEVETQGGSLSERAV